MKQVILNENKLNGFVINETAPIGTIIQYSGNCPNGSVDCNGMSLNRTDYARLFNAIGTKYGSDSDTTFKVPLITDKAETDVEYMTGKRNADGKPIYYRKVTEINKSITSTWVTMVTIEGIEKVISCSASGTADSNPNACVPYTKYINNNIQCYVDSYAFVVNTIELEYTKTTDTENTFCYNQLQGNNFCIKATDYSQATEDVIDDTKATTGNCWSASEVNKRLSYSTTETVIGTWIDGKPIYRKVFTNLNQTIGATWTNANNVQLSNVNEIINGSLYADEGSSGGGVQVRYVNIGYLSGNVRLYSSQNVTMQKLVVEYTKTTD